MKSTFALRSSLRVCSVCSNSGIFCSIVLLRCSEFSSMKRYFLCVHTLSTEHSIQSSEVSAPQHLL